MNNLRRQWGRLSTIRLWVSGPERSCKPPVGVRFRPSAPRGTHAACSGAPVSATDGSNGGSSSSQERCCRLVIGRCRRPRRTTCPRGGASCPRGSGRPNELACRMQSTTSVTARTTGERSSGPNHKSPAGPARLDREGSLGIRCSRAEACVLRLFPCPLGVTTTRTMQTTPTHTIAVDISHHGKVRCKVRWLA